ncbi:hypothetical protein FRC11_004755 [Ceratobasidium sp. 423]|nr:hypothetical protein FRC11_004755 [Ceratobasidium sp. 423]
MDGSGGEPQMWNRPAASQLLDSDVILVCVSHPSMAGDVQHPWAERDGWPVRTTLLRLSHDVLLEVVCLLDLGSLLSVRQVCRVLSAITRENIIFIRLLKRPFPPPVPAPTPEERVIRTHRLHKNWDLAALPVTVRTSRGDTVAARVTRRLVEPVQAPTPAAAPPLAYHLPPGADAYPFLKLETFAPFRDSATKQASFGPDRPAPIPIVFPTRTPPVNAGLSEATRSLVQAQLQHITQHRSEPGPSTRPPPPPLASNFAAAVVRAWNTTQPANVSPPVSSTPQNQVISPPPAPAPRPTRVSSLAVRAIFAKIVGGGRWGVFVIKRDANFKGKQRADDPARPLTTEALVSLGKGKGKGKEPDQAAETPQAQPQPLDEGAFLVIYDLDEVFPEQAVYALEEYEVPPMGETCQPTVPLQRQWIRSPDLQNCTFVEGPVYADGPLPDLALWTFETAPHRAVAHWLLRPVSDSDNSSMDVELGHDPPPSSVDSDLYTPGTAPYVFPAQKICTTKLSFPHHKVTFAPGARRGMWFERPERSRSGQARGMRGVWGYTAVDPSTPTVRSCTSELPEDVLGAMENNTLGVAFDELSGRMVAVTCGDGYSALTGSKVWVLDYA